MDNNFFASIGKIVGFVIALFLPSLINAIFFYAGFLMFGPWLDELLSFKLPPMSFVACWGLMLMVSCFKEYHIEKDEQ